MELSIFNADKIIVPSLYVKQKLIEKLNIQDHKINTVYLGVDHIFSKFNNNPLIKDFNYDKNIFYQYYHVKYHNILNLLLAFKKFKDELKTDIKFVIVLSILDKEYYKKLIYLLKKIFKNEVEILKNIENNYLPTYKEFHFIYLLLIQKFSDLQLWKLFRLINFYFTIRYIH